MQKNLFTEIPAKLPALVAFIMLTMSFSACSKDDDNGIVNEKNAVVINGVEKPVVSAELEIEDGDLELLFYLDEKKNESIEIYCNVNRHFGRNIDLRQKENANDHSYSWEIMYFVNGSCFFHADGRIREKQPLDPLYANSRSENKLHLLQEYDAVTFRSGTLRMDYNDKTGEYELRLTNGKVLDDIQGNGEEYNISMYFKGKITGEAESF